MKNKLIVSMVFVTLSTLSVSSFAAMSCVWTDKQKIREIRIGYVTDNKVGGTDSGNAIRVIFKNNKKVYAANKANNLNDDNGRAMFSLLTTAMLTGKSVQLWDHKGKGGGNCDDFDEVIIYND